MHDTDGLALIVFKQLHQTFLAVPTEEQISVYVCIVFKKKHAFIERVFSWCVVGGMVLGNYKIDVGSNPTTKAGQRFPTGTSHIKELWKSQ